MPEESVKVPMALTSEEIKVGISDEIHRAIRASLDKTCSLNSTTFPKFRAKWWVEYELDDFGRIEAGGIGGNIGQVKQDVLYRAVDVVNVMLADESFRPARQQVEYLKAALGESPTKRVEGTIEPMPPDAFRRKSKQPIPAPTVIKKKDENAPGITKTKRRSVKGKDA